MHKLKNGTCTADCSNYVKYKLANYLATEPVKFEIKCADNQLSIKIDGLPQKISTPLMFIIRMAYLVTSKQARTFNRILT